MRLKMMKNRSIDRSNKNLYATRTIVRWGVVALLLVAALVTGCRGEVDQGPITPTATPTTALPLTAYATRTIAAATPTPPGATATPIPSPTPTPRVHVIALNQTLISIANLYGVSLETLQNANPEVNPWALVVGQELLIPWQEPLEDGQNPTPTPQPVVLSPARCFEEASGGLWCLWSALNPPDIGTENILVEIALQSNTSNQRLSQVVTAPLNIAAAGTRVPMGAFFSAQQLAEAEFTPPYQAVLTLQQALPYAEPSSRYLPVMLRQQQIDIQPDGLSAEITGSLVLTGEATASAAVIWTAAALYNTDDELIGFRRWESNQALAPGERLPFAMFVFSLGGEHIRRVEILLEARP